MRRLPAYTTSWDEGRYFDRWMVVHFLSGLSGGFSNVLFGLTTRNVWLVGLALLLLWEVFERVRGIRECWENALLDFVVGAAGIAVALLIGARLSTGWARAAFGLSSLAFVAGSAVGWLAYRRRRARGAPATP